MKVGLLCATLPLVLLASCESQGREIKLSPEKEAEVRAERLERAGTARWKRKLKELGTSPEQVAAQARNERISADDLWKSPLPTIKAMALLPLSIRREALGGSTVHLNPTLEDERLAAFGPKPRDSCLRVMQHFDPTLADPESPWFSWVGTVKGWMRRGDTVRWGWHQTFKIWWKDAEGRHGPRRGGTALFRNGQLIALQIASGEFYPVVVGADGYWAEPGDPGVDPAIRDAEKRP